MGKIWQKQTLKINKQNLNKPVLTDARKLVIDIVFFYSQDN